MELRGSCNGCGACCKVLVLEQSPDEVRQMAALTRVLGIPSDHIFAAEHWHPLTREEAMRLNAFYTSRVRADAHFYTCDRLGADGRCTAYEGAAARLPRLPVVRRAAARDAARRSGMRLRGRPAGPLGLTRVAVTPSSSRRSFAWTTVT